MSRQPSSAPSGAGGRKRSGTVSSLNSSSMKLRESVGGSTASIPAPPLRIGDFAVLTPTVDTMAAQPIQVNHDMWPGLREGDYIRMTEKGEQRGESLDGFLFRWTSTMHVDKHNVQIMFSSAFASQFWSNRDVRLTKVAPNEFAAEFVEIYFQDQYLGRSEMWRATNFLVGQCVHVDQKITYGGCTDATIKAIYIDQQKVSSASVSASTKVIFRSLSAKVTLFIQVCRELWHFSDDGERYYEKLVHSFLPSLFERWRELNTNHVVTIVLISRVYYAQSELELAAGPLRKDDNGNDYKDFFRVLVDLEVLPENDWQDNLVTIKQSLWTFQRDILLTHHYHRAKARAEAHHAGRTDDKQSEPPSSRVSEDGSDTMASVGVPILGTISSAHDGPILEALNLALNPTEKHYIDRALSITGTSTIIVTPGTGHFAVSKHLLQLTTCRVLDQGFGLDLVCLSRPPLHRSPIFSFKAIDPGLQRDSLGGFTGKATASAAAGTRRLDPLWAGEPRIDGLPREKTTYYWEPPWVSVSFWEKQMDMAMRPDRFVARSRMHDIQMMSLLESDLLAAIEIPFLGTGQSPKNSRLGHRGSAGHRKSAWDAFDADIFSVETDEEHDIGPSPRTAEVSASLTTSSGGSTVVSASYKTIRDRTERERSGRVTPLHTPISGSPPGEIILSSKRTSRIQAVPTITETPETPSAMLPPLDPMAYANAPETRPEKSLELSILRNREIPSQSFASKASSWLINALRPVTSPTMPTRPVTAADMRAGLESSSRPPSPTKPLSIKSSSSPLEIKGSQAARRAKSTMSRQFSEEEVMQSRLHQSRASPSATPPQSLGSGSLGNRAGKGLLGSRVEKLERKPALPNPSRPMTAVPYAQASLARRWQHIFPRPVFQHTMKWKSMTAPACLPLTVQFLPAAAELELDFELHGYTFIVIPEMRSFFLRDLAIPPHSDEDSRSTLVLSVLRGMTALRLAQGFQFVLDPDSPPPDVPGVGSSSFRDSGLHSARGRGHSNANANPLQKNRHSGVSDFLKDPRKPVYLSMSNEIHRISSNGDVVEVKRYLRRMPTAQFDYQCLVWTKMGDGYSSVKTSFAFPNLETYGWNKLDLLIAGYESNFHNSLRYWRTRFLVLPTNPTTPEEGLNDEEIRLKGADRLAELFSRARWTSTSTSPLEVLAPLRFVPTTLGPAACILDASVTERIERLHRDGPLGKRNLRGHILSLTTGQLASLMRECAKDIPIRTYKWHSNTYHDAFTGSDMVSWMLRDFKDVHTREQAAEIAATFHKHGLFTHARDRHPFLDGNYFYQLTPDYARGRTASRPSFITLPTGISARALMSSSESPPIPTGPAKPQLLLSQTCVIDVDASKRSDQAERVVLHHDVIHNPANAFHFQLEWMGTTAKCIQDVLRQWNKAIEKSGLKIVEAYVDQITDIRTKNVFQSCLPIRLAVAPPVLPAGTLPEGVRADIYFESTLLRMFEFILDVEADSSYSDRVDVVYSYRASTFRYPQYVHRTGAAFVQIVGGHEGFRWLKNRLLHAERGTSAAEDAGEVAEGVRRQLQTLCASEEGLTAFYEETLKAIPPPSVSPTTMTNNSAIVD
ncbi:hypothetical protein BKA62DRAFT_136205 [Auriculariales sp. MPI-PUGE-AT-0066]|nr:hypothetical protein BKA62DRAFT_136205 [Auriculariales sp. MPI-PUGE-AT-0066]